MNDIVQSLNFTGFLLLVLRNDFFFIKRKLKKKIQKDIKKRDTIEEQINRLQNELKGCNNDIDDDILEFYQEVDKTTVISTLEFYEKNSPKRKEVACQIKKRFTEEKLLIEDTLNLVDWYEKMHDDYNDKI